MKSSYLTDTHFHLDLSDDIDTIIMNAKEKKVGNFIISGCDLKGINEGLEIIRRYDDIYLTIGIHPDEIKDFNDETIHYLESLIKDNSKIIGIGEIGLDYYHNEYNKDDQKRIFRLQLDLATKLNMPVVIHSREAFQDTYDILKEYKLKGIIHCFSGSIETAIQYISIGYVLGIGGVLTFKNSKLKDTLKEIDIRNIVFETDSPYISPEPSRKYPNSPKNISLICDYLCMVKNIDRDEMIKITNDNVKRIFKI